MNRLDTLFQHKKSNIFSLYFCAGYPHLHNTQEVLETLEHEGVDIVEIGIPFSDPMADGVVIQEASHKALQNGMSLALLFSELRSVRKKVHIPLVLMGYLNPIMQYGFRAFFASCETCGIDACIIPDLPFAEYKETLRALADEYGVKIIMLITPETSEARVREIDANTDAFIYMVSSAATTGAQEKFDDSCRAYFKKIKDMRLRSPCMIGFGISNSKTFRAACDYAAGAIIGSRFIKLLGETDNPQQAVRELKKKIGLE